MNNKDTIIKSFISNFVVKHKRERSLLELLTPKRRSAFISRFNHNRETVVNMDYLNKIDKELDYPAKIEEPLGFKDEELCYVISHYDEVDDQILKFKNVFDFIYGRGFASIVMNLSATRFYLETEQIQGAPERFIGKRIK